MLIRAGNLAAMLLALALSMASTLASPVTIERAAAKTAVHPDVRFARLPDGSPALIDATDTAVPLRAYERIVAGSTVADELLLALCEPSRIAAFTVYSAERAPHRHRFAGKPSHPGLQNLERILALHPDLVVTHHLGDGQAIARLREHGIAVFDLGPMRGLRTLPGDVHQLAHLLGEPQRGVEYAALIARRMAAVARGIAPAQRKRALYVSVYGDKLYGGTLGTSYHDVLVAAGLVDVAALRYRDWPAYTAEELLALDPELLVTSERMGAVLCRHPGLDQLRPCRTPDAIIEIDSHLLANAGPAMIETAERIHERAHGGIAPALRGGVRSAPVPP